ncbi:MAG: photosystem II biogenesis protein Psp29 [Spirulinaceae cyanobacterium SM2_1_0]|nr:photosystem II biogenesis protein Psp29 [Spirulinaceae cyanobacterium SM2_1_0]
MNAVRTLSDTKRSFYARHTRPVNSIYRRVVEELMVEMHLLSVNNLFRYDPIYALGVVSAYDRLMAGYRPDVDRDSIFGSLCRSIEAEPDQYRHDADGLRAIADRLSPLQLADWRSALPPLDGTELLHDTLQAVATNEKFKYSRLFAIGLYTLVERADTEIARDTEKRNEILASLSESLNIPSDKLEKDLELYQGNVEKMEQARIIIEDTLANERKKREAKAAESQPQDPAPETSS